MLVEHCYYAMVLFVQFCFYLVFHLVFKAFFRAEITGIENIPVKPFILASNHTAKIDPFLLCQLPFSAAKQLMPIYFLTSEYYYRKWYLKPILKLLGCYPVIKRAWTLEEFLSSSLKKLKDGKIIVFFPEGKIIRNNEKDKPRPGIGYLAKKSGKSILPLHIKWTGVNIFRSNKMTLSFGKLVTFQGESDQLNSYEKEAERIMKIIYSL